MVRRKSSVGSRSYPLGGPTITLSGSFRPCIQSKARYELHSICRTTDVNVTTAIRANAAPERAILREIERSGADLVVLGVDRIRGETLSFGGVAAAVLRESKVSVLLISTGDSGGNDSKK